MARWVLVLKLQPLVGRKFYKDQAKNSGIHPDRQVANGPFRYWATPVRKAEHVQCAACELWWEPSSEHRFRQEAIQALQLRKASREWPFNGSELQRSNAFTLLELLIVIGIIGLLLVLIAPGFTSIKSGSDFSSAVNGIRDVLENARTYAKANRTYVFVGLAEADSSVGSGVTPQVTTVATPYGGVAVAVVASKDGTRHFNHATSNQGPTGRRTMAIQQNRNTWEDT